MMKKIVTFLTIVLFCLQLSAQTKPVWTLVSPAEISGHEVIGSRIYSERQQLFRVDVDELKKKLINVEDKFSGLPGVEISFPNIDGDLEKFLVWENSNFEPGLQAKYPNIRAYIGKSLTDKGAVINFSLSPGGVQTMVLRPDRGTEFIESYTTDSVIYVLFDSKTRVEGKLPFNCGVVDQNLNNGILNKVENTVTSNNLSYKTLRLAISCDSEYAQYYLGIGQTPLEGMNATMTRVNGIFEKDLAVHMNIIANNELVIFTDPVTDPYSSSSVGMYTDPNNPPFALWSTELQDILTYTLGNDAYDIGHLFAGKGGDGNSGGIGNVCVNDDGGSQTQSKGKAFSSAYNSTPKGDGFDVAVVCHEMGHQLGANHTFSHTIDLNFNAQIEPGSGSTIMSYAGITNYNVQLNPDPYFTYKSIFQIQENLKFKFCPVSTIINNNTVPVVNAGPDFTVPSGTAYILKGTANDNEGDGLTYCWEQNDPIQSASQTGSNSRSGPAKLIGPTFRSFLPMSSPNRYMPKYSDVLAGNGNLSFTWESVSTVERDLRFTLTVRDNNVNGSQTQTDEVIVTSKAPYNASTAPSGVGPFKVTSQSTTGITWTSGDSQEITWSVNNTTSLPGSTAVNIKLSIDGGITFPYVLAAATPNDGTELITVPVTSQTSANCRLWIEPIANNYYAVNSKEFTVISNLANEDFDLAGFSLYPNPNKGSFTVQFKELTTDFSVKVYDLTGKVIYTNSFGQLSDLSQKINLENTSSGVYFIKIKSGSKDMTQKLIIQ